jgi:hypothetical protein
MKIIAKPVEMVCEFNRTGEVVLNIFRIEGKNGPEVVQVDRVLRCEEEKLAGNKMLKFLCESEIHGKIRIYEIKYELLTCKWVLFRM